MYTETSRETDFRRAVGADLSWCSRCGEASRMVTPQVAAQFFNVRLRSIYCWADAGTIHSTETPEGLLLVCLNSLQG